MSGRRGHRPPRLLEWDEGVASERTVLAWERTAISSLAVAALIIRAGIVAGPLAVAIPLAAVMVGAAAGEWRYSKRIYAQHGRPLAEGAVLHDRAIIALVAVTVILAVGSGWLVVNG